mmetsp:Transcript_27043/g.71132  ORF Transcript_27043/g.71132 Transcript_27043/m.71132 type:complete len:227 (-) Transcript_27043:1390-2070(-)
MVPRSCATCWRSAKCVLPRVLRTAASPVSGGDTTAGCAGAVCVLPTVWEGANAQDIKHQRVSVTFATSCRLEAIRKLGARGSSLGRKNCTLLMGALRPASGLRVTISCGHRWVRRPMGPVCCARSSRSQALSWSCALATGLGLCSIASRLTRSSRRRKTLNIHQLLRTARGQQKNVQPHPRRLRSYRRRRLMPFPAAGLGPQCSGTTKDRHPFRCSSCPPGSALGS